MSGQSLIEKNLAGISDILPPSAPEVATAPSIGLVAMVVVIFLIAGATLLWRMGARHRLSRLAHSCETGELGARDAAHRLAAELAHYCEGGRLNESSPLQGLSVDVWSNYLSLLSAQRFGAEEPAPYAVAQSVRRAERWLRWTRRVG